MNTSPTPIPSRKGRSTRSLGALVEFLNATSTGPSSEEEIENMARRHEIESDTWSQEWQTDHHLGLV